MKNVLITGASSGIGKATAIKFAENGYNLVINSRKQEKLNSLKDDLVSSFGIEVKCVVFDVSDRSKVIEELSKLNLPIDILINNAGLALGKDSFQESSIDDWEKMMQINVMGVLFVSHFIAKKMIANGSGHIINVSSIAGKQVYAGGNVYCASKASVDAITKSLRIDLLKEGIKVSSVSPGNVETNFSNIRFKGDLDKVENIYSGYKPLLAKDIADLIYFISDRPEHVNIDDIIVTPKAQANAYYLNRKG